MQDKIGKLQLNYQKWMDQQKENSKTETVKSEKAVPKPMNEPEDMEVSDEDEEEEMPFVQSHNEAPITKIEKTVVKLKEEKITPKISQVGFHDQTENFLSSRPIIKCKLENIDDYKISIDNIFSDETKIDEDLHNSNGKRPLLFLFEDDDDDDEFGGKRKKKLSIKKESKEEEEDTLEKFMKENDRQKNAEDLMNKNMKEKKLYEVKTRSGNITTNDLTNGDQKKKNIKIHCEITNVLPDESLETPLLNSHVIDNLNEDEDDDDTLEGLVASLKNPGKNKSEMLKTDHSRVYYKKFRKIFYNEIPEISKISDHKIHQLRQQWEIHVRGRRCPRPITEWAHCGFSIRILDTLKAHEFTKSTPIQSQSLPIILSGRNMIGIAKTGSGKTLAFLLPLLRHVMDQPPLDSGDGPIAIIMVPTRELCLQIFKECRRFTKSLDLNVVPVYGGTGIADQIAELRRGANIIVCTPGRMIDLLVANNGRVTNLRRVTYVVIDEADRMFDMGFEPQVKKILDNIRPDRQLVMFSATFPKPMETLARAYLDKPIAIIIGGRSVVCSDIEQHIILIEEDKKYLKLLELLGIYTLQGSVLVFVERQETADEIQKSLLSNMYTSFALHGGVDQYDRASIISDFKAGIVTVLVATSVAARGLDVKKLICVINFDCPNHYEDYVHRCGRTGRAGNKGFAFTFITQDQDNLAGDLVKALELSHIPIPEQLDLMWKAYVARMAKEGKQVRLTHHGTIYRGKGFRFDHKEMKLAENEKKDKMNVMGVPVIDSDEENDEKLKTVENTINDFMGKWKTVNTDVTVDSDKPMNQLINIDDGKNMKNFTGSRFEDIAQPPTLQTDNGEKPPGIVEIPKEDGVFDEIRSIRHSEAAKRAAEKLNRMLNYNKTTNESSIDNYRKLYIAEIDINDLPQTARLRLTSRQFVTEIQEITKVGISVRGTYIDPSKKKEKKKISETGVLPLSVSNNIFLNLEAPEEKKLHIRLESYNENDISYAKQEIKRILREELTKIPIQYSVHRGRFKF
ncbi:hypothetical protein SNEBB_010012 [Seison nebaliae]|nr:hypothetical protein SNEBB_010012 [Seison nebaliae]